MNNSVRRTRADVLLVEKGLFESRSKAQAAISAGLVSADGAFLKKPSESVPSNAELVASAAFPWVSRGGVKLAAALDHFELSPSGLNCLDVGASTGGFTDVLLNRGARQVTAVDVGKDQLHPKIARNRRVLSLENTDIRSIVTGSLPEMPTFAVVDVSFISLRLILPSIAQLLARQAQLICLIKPQFEAGRKAVVKGIVRDELIHAEVCEAISESLKSLGWTIMGLIESPIMGGDGNREFLMAASRT